MTRILPDTEQTSSVIHRGKMNYLEYFIKCRKNYIQDKKPSLDSFYRNPVIEIPQSILTEKYFFAVDELSKIFKEKFDNMPKEGNMLTCDNFWPHQDLLRDISNDIVPFLEKERYGCNLYVDKIYIYRTLSIEDRVSSYLWHYDNNPSEIVKNIIYLNDVGDKNSPFEYLSDKNGVGFMKIPSRTGPNNWIPAKNNSRITKKQMEKYLEKGYSGRKMYGKKGSVFSFNNNAIHRANPILEGYRDVVNIRVKPTLKKINYIDKKWTSGYEKSGAVNPHPDRF